MLGDSNFSRGSPLQYLITLSGKKFEFFLMSLSQWKDQVTACKREQNILKTVTFTSTMTKFFIYPLEELIFAVKAGIYHLVHVPSTSS